MDITRVIRCWGEATLLATLLFATPCSLLAAPPDEPQLTRAPELIEFIEADYPQTERDAGIGATVLLRLTIDADGRVEAVEVIESAGEVFDAAARAAALRFRFSPAEVDGVPTTIRLNYRYVFEPPPPPRGALSGTVLITRERPLADVEIQVSAESLAAPIIVRTDNLGYFRVDELPAGPVHLTILRPELDPLETDETIIADEELAVIYEVGEPSAEVVESSGDDLQLVVIAPPLRREAVTTKVAADEAARVPGSSGDVVRVIESLPGVGRATAGSGQLVVWGAAPGDTRVYVDGVPIPRLYHEGGLRSVVHPFLVGSLELSPGGYGAAWGRGLGGLVRIETQTPAGEGSTGRIAADLLDASAVVSVPIGERVRMAVAGRFGYVKYWTDALLPARVTALVPIPVYGDGQLRLAWQPSASDRVEFVALTSHDRFVRRVIAPDPALSIADSRALDFQRLYARWTRDTGSGAQLSVTPFVGFARERQSASFGALTTSLDSDTWLGGVRVGSSHRVRPWLQVEVGLDAQVELTRLERRGALALPAREGDVRVFGQPPPTQIAGDRWTTTQLGLAPYIEAEFSVARGKLRIIPGLRVDPMVRSVGRRNPPTAGTPAVGLFAEDFGVEPRLALLAKPLERWQLRAAVGLYRQNPAATDLSAAFGNPRLPAARALHVVGGTAVDLTKTLSLDLTGFFTRSRALAMRSADTVPLPAELLEPSGAGRAYGLQVLLRQAEWKSLFGWIAYTYMRSERRDRPGAGWRLSDFDQTHVLTLVAGYELPLQFELGARFRLASGLPRTEVVDAWFDTTRNLYQPVFAEQNQIRLPLFVQFDLRVGKRFEFEGSTLEVYLEVLNVWNQANAEEFVYSSDYQQRGQLRGFPVFPALGVQWDF